MDSFDLPISDSSWRDASITLIFRAPRWPPEERACGFSPGKLVLFELSHILLCEARTDLDRAVGGNENTHKKFRNIFALHVSTWQLTSPVRMSVRCLALWLWGADLGRHRDAHPDGAAPKGCSRKFYFLLPFQGPPFHNHFQNPTSGKCHAESRGYSSALARDAMAGFRGGAPSAAALDRRVTAARPPPRPKE